MFRSQGDPIVTGMDSPLPVVGEYPLMAPISGTPSIDFVATLLTAVMHPQ